VRAGALHLLGGGAEVKLVRDQVTGLGRQD
jgi:hypothetical protein